LPISTSEEFIGRSQGGLYGDVIETIDWSMGVLFDALRESGIEDNTLVVFTSDNGPWQDLPDRMLQRGVERWHSGSAGLLKGSKATTYEGGFRVPAIIRWPKQIPEGQVSHNVVTTMDLFTTLIQIAEADLPDDRQIDGQNVYPLLTGEQYTSPELFFYCNGTALEAVRKGNWKLRYTGGSGPELFDLDTDPGENFNIAEENKALVGELYREMAAFSKETNARLEAGEY
jgi:arylsulfatase A-like enzyme